MEIVLAVVMVLVIILRGLHKMKKTYIPAGLHYILRRNQYEYQHAVSCLILLKSVDESTYDSDTWQYYFDKAVELKILMQLSIDYCLQQLFDKKPENYVIDSNFIYVEAEYLGEHGTELPIKESTNFTDVCVAMYPEYIKRDNNRNISSPVSRSFTFQVTDACNLACTYCYQRHKGAHSMSFETAQKAIDMLLTDSKGIDKFMSSKATAVPVIEFIGGEPLLEHELIDNTITAFQLRAMKVRHPWALTVMFSLCSNGVLYQLPEVKQLMQRHYQILDVSITVDGTRELHDSCRRFPDGSPSYDLAHFAALDCLRKRGASGTKITLAPNNIHYLCECLKAIIEDGYTQINANTVYEEGWTIEHAKILYQQIKDFTNYCVEHPELFDIDISLLSENVGRPKFETDVTNWCGGNGIMLSMDYKGDLYPCIRYMESSLNGEQEPVIIGNVNDGYVPHKCQQDCLNCFLLVDRRTQSTDQCFYCCIAEHCAWCTAYNYQKTGTPNKRVTYICEMHKARSLGCVLYWNAKYKTTGSDKVKDLWLPKHWAVPIVGEEEYQYLVDIVINKDGYVNTTESSTFRIPNGLYDQFGTLDHNNDPNKYVMEDTSND